MITIRTGKTTIAGKTSQQGVGLIEVMVSMLILLVGILGVASMQARGISFNKSSYFRTQAGIYAEDFFDRMRANREAAAKGSYTIGSRSILGSAPAKSCLDSACSSEELAAYDKYNWFQSVDETLPFADASVTRKDSLITLILRWDDDKRGSAGTQCGVDTTCFAFTSRL